MATLDVDLSHRLRDVHLELTLAVGAETLALVGPSGAGKSSVLRAVAGLLRPDRGRIAVSGAPWLDTEAGLDVPPERRSVGLVFQEYALFPHLSVRANVLFGAADDDRADEVMSMLRIGHLAAERPGRISGGERSALRSRARSPASRRYCCSTSRSRRSTPIPGMRYVGSSASCWRPCVCRRSSSHTTSKTLPSSRTRSA
jgi:ABC-type molybdate transport system ATPase subunit